MADRVCDEETGGACAALRKIYPYLRPVMVGEENKDLRFSVRAVSDQISPYLQMTLLYCPFCGARLAGKLAERIEEDRR